MEVNTADGDVVTYEYDDENIRVSSTVNGTKTTYLLDSNRPYAQVLEEYEDESLKVRYVQGLDLISVERDGEVSVYLVDGLGSTRTLTDLDGEVVATYTYDAFGELLGSTGEVENDYLFAGEQFDGELGQYYLRQRFYDAGVGRFTRRDSWEGRIGEPVTLHKYLYGNGNPVNFVDPSGLSALSAFSSTSLNISQQMVAILAGIGAVGTVGTVGIVVTADSPSQTQFPFPGAGSIPDDINTQETFPNNNGILDRILDFGRRMGGFGEGVEPDIDTVETFPRDIGDFVAYVFYSGDVRLPDDSSQLNHIFRESPGHLPDTPANRESLISLSNDRNNYLGRDKYGVEWYGKLLDDGRQLWSSVRNGVIRNGGVNSSPRSFNPDNGLSGARYVPRNQENRP